MQNEFDQQYYVILEVRISRSDIRLLIKGNLIAVKDCARAMNIKRDKSDDRKM